jgi:hypothetical protein
MKRASHSASIAWLVAAIGALHAAPGSAADPPAGATILFADELTKTYSPDWHINHGEWKIVNGGLRAIEDLSENHGAAARYRTGVMFTDAEFEYEFRLDGSKMIALSINDMTRHLCRVRITPSAVQVIKDDTDAGAGPDKSETVATTKAEIAPGAWHKLKITFTGNVMTVDVLTSNGDGVVAKGKHAIFGEPKENFALIVSGDSASFRNFRSRVPAGSTTPAPERKRRASTGN